MKQLFLNVSDGSMKLIDQPMPTVKENMALVETLYTVVSAGTERTGFLWWKEFDSESIGAPGSGEKSNGEVVNRWDRYYHRECF